MIWILSVVLATGTVHRYEFQSYEDCAKQQQAIKMTLQGYSVCSQKTKD